MCLFRSFKHYNFRLFFVGQGLSILGAWMQLPATSWLTWRLSHSSEWLGLVGFAGQIPVLIFGLLGGVAAERAQRRRLIIIIQTLAMAQAAILAALTLSGNITVPLIFLLALFLGTVFAFDYPARQTFLMDMVGKEDISNAVALNSSLVHGARVIGPVVAGFIVKLWGEGICFVINAVSFLFVLASLLFMREKELLPQASIPDRSVKESIIEGLKVIRHMKELRRPLILMATLSIAAMPYMILLPQIINSKFGGGAGAYGLAMGVAGFGALSGAIYFAARKTMNGLYNIVRMSLILNGIALIIFAFMPTFFLAVPALMLTGLFAFLVVAGCNTILQINAPPEFRGRAMSIFTLAFFGVAPIGSISAGFIAHFIGPELTIAIGGTICIVKGIRAFSKTKS